MLWQTSDRNLTLLAAVHLMDGEGCVPSAAMERAYSQAKKVVFESDLDVPADPAKLMLPDDGRLEDLVPEPLWSTVREAWSEAGLPPDYLERISAWHAALCFMSASANRLGITPDKGVDRHFWARSAQDGLIRDILEDQADVFQAFGRVPLEEQFSMLALFADARQTGKEVASMVRAWRSNDGAVFEAIRKRRLSICPAGFRILLGDRNRAWLPKLLKSAEDGVPTLVVVGALHCYGPEGLPFLMQQAGVSVAPV